MAEKKFLRSTFDADEYRAAMNPNMYHGTHGTYGSRWSKFNPAGRCNVCKKPTTSIVWTYKSGTSKGTFLCRDHHPDSSSLINQRKSGNDPVEMRNLGDPMLAEVAFRAAVRLVLSEIVRKKPGTESTYILYAPNQGKKKPPKAVGEFPTRDMAKKAELERFPPRDTDKLNKARKRLQRMKKRKDMGGDRRVGGKTRAECMAARIIEGLLGGGR